MRKYKRINQRMQLRYADCMYVVIKHIIMDGSILAKSGGHNVNTKMNTK